MTFYTLGQPADLAPLARRIWYWPVVRGVLALAFGLLAILWPDKTPAVLVQVFGAFLVVDGLVSLVDGVRRRGTGAGTVNTGFGAVALAFGAALLLLPDVFLAVIVVLIGIWAMVLGLLQVFAGLVLRRRGGTAWLWSLVSGVLFCALAVVCFTNPSGTIEVMAIVVGAFAVVIGVALIAVGLRMRALGRTAGSGQGDVIDGEVIED